MLANRPDATIRTPIPNGNWKNTATPCATGIAGRGTPFDTAVPRVTRIIAGDA